jgi:hypothetical protein
VPEDEGLDPLIKDFQDQLSARFALFDSLIEECRQMGLTGLLIMGEFDPLTQVPHNQWRAFGNPLTVLGQVEQWRASKQATMRGEMALVDHGDDEG